MVVALDSLLESSPAKLGEMRLYSMFYKLRNEGLRNPLFALKILYRAEHRASERHKEPCQNPDLVLILPRWCRGFNSVN